jgi:hypothetical protein
MNAEELSEELKNFQLLELSYFSTAMSTTAAMPSSTADQPITQSVEQTWLTRTLADQTHNISTRIEVGGGGRRPPGVVDILRQIHANSLLYSCYYTPRPPGWCPAPARC